MKLSIAWIFSHLDADYAKQDILKLVQKFNLTTAEIELVEKVSYDLSAFTLAQVTEINQDMVLVHSRELNQTIELSVRSDCAENSFYLLVHDNGTWRWASMKDWKSSKDVLLPAFSCTGPQCAGSWKEMFDADDYILHVDNKSITHRPDLWSHRGFAREFAAILGVALLPESSIYAEHRIEAQNNKIRQTTGNPFSFELQDQTYCKRFAALYIPNIGNYASWLWMAQRLSKVDTKPIDALVDTTNYVMLDIGQPLHAFDAEKIKSHHVVPRLAYSNEKLVLLDGQTVELTDHDIVITDGKNPVALGGIMGGKYTAITKDTRSILVESATFDAAAVRKTAQRLKLRTDASSRFEKTIDPNMNVLGLLRFLKILEEQSIPLIAAGDIISLGQSVNPSTIEIGHATLERSLGVTLSPAFVKKTLEAIEFAVEVTESSPGHSVYRIIVPTFRGTKDVRLPEDIVEEIGRFYGYGNIPQELPELELKPHSLHNVLRLRTIRQFFAGGLQAREVYNYPLYDESFLQELQWKPQGTVKLINPLSQNWEQLVTSLIPHLVRSVIHAGTHQEELRFFEWGTVWKRVDEGLREQKSLAAILYHKKEEIDFYVAKDQLDRLFDLLGIPVSWTPYDGADQCYHPYKAATLRYNNEIIGYAGIANRAYLQPVVEGNAFICELSGDLLLLADKEQEKFKPLTKYQDTWFDVSLFVPVEVTVEKLKQSICAVDTRIVSVELIDFFEKFEWVDKRSVTLRVIIQDSEKTLTKEEIDLLYAAVVDAVQKQGTTIR